MRCPKCQYIAFEASDRCRHCGYDFSLVEPPAPPADLPMRGDEAGPLADFVIRDRVEPDAARAETRRPRASLEEAGRMPRSTPAVTPDLPLFGEGRTESRTMPEPVLAPPRAPRAPLAVRRNTPEPVRLRARPARPRRETPALDLEPAREAVPTEADDADTPAEFDDAADGRAPAEAPRASVLARLAGGMIDAIIIGAVDIAVIYSTLWILGLGWLGIFTLSRMPLLGFFLVLNGGYLAVFTAASGQTVGKMMTGVRVVQQNGRPVAFGQALLRTAAYAVSVVPFGLGFVPALVGPRLALHDRIAGTRVVKAA